MAEVVEAFEPQLKQIGIVPSDGGRFEVEVNGELVYSKLETGRHLEPGEIVNLVENYLNQSSG